MADSARRLVREGLILDFHVDDAGNRYLAGFILSALGIFFLVAGYLYLGTQDSSAVEPLAAPLLEGLSVFFLLLPLALIAMGLIMVIRAYRLAAKTPRKPVGTVDRHDR